jgi:hypothetical protein
MSEGDDKMSDKIITIDIYTELERYMDYITQQLKDNLQDVIDNAIDAQLYIDLSTKEPTGFDIGIVIGGPNIRLVYSRGACQLRGLWGTITDEKDVDNEICETILDYLTDYLNFHR